MRRLAVLHFIRPLSLLGVLWLCSFVLMTAPPVHAQSNTICDTVTEISTADCRALVALYESTNGAAWTHNEGWLVTNTPCSWYGIHCSLDHTVYLLELPANNLVGSLPPELGNLTPFRLDLSTNQLSGPIPPELGKLEGDGSFGMAQVNLSNNQLSGPIPPQLGNMHLVSVLNLSNNQLSGPIPAELSNLDGQGMFPFIELDLSNNQLSGEIPASLGQMGDGTLGITWDFSHNQLTRTLPLGLVGTEPIGNLNGLDVSDNPLSGPLPADFLDSSLSVLGFSNTAICEPEDATFQSWLFRIRLLGSSEQTCLCDSANLVGVSTTECDGLVALFNATNGDQWTQKANWLATLDPCTWQGVTCVNGAVSTLTLSDNRLMGRLPETLGNLTHLTQLYLDNNLLTNVLPQRLTQLTQLSTFHFDDTLLCEPAENVLQTWLSGIANLQRTSLPCYLTHFPIVAR